MHKKLFLCLPTVLGTMNNGFILMLFTTEVTFVPLTDRIVC